MENLHISVSSNVHIMRFQKVIVSLFKAMWCDYDTCMHSLRLALVGHIIVFLGNKCDAASLSPRSINHLVGIEGDR
jgi:hypothetical protein